MTTRKPKADPLVANGMDPTWRDAKGELLSDDSIHALIGALRSHLGAKEDGPRCLLGPLVLDNYEGTYTTSIRLIFAFPAGTAIGDKAAKFFDSVLLGSMLSYGDPPEPGEPRHSPCVVTRNLRAAH